MHRVKRYRFWELVRLFLDHYIFSRQKAYIFYRTISDNLPEPDTREFEIHNATFDDIEKFKAFGNINRYTKMKEWISRGNFLLIALLKGQPIAYHCLAKQTQRRAPENHFPLLPNQAWVIDIYTLPQFRGRRTAALIRNYREWYLGKQGFKEIVGCIKSDNISSLRYAASSSYRQIKYFSFIRILWVTKYHIESDASQRFYTQLKEIDARN